MPPKFRLFNEGLNYKVHSLITVCHISFASLQNDHRAYISHSSDYQVAKVPLKPKASPRFLSAGRKQKLNSFLKKVDIEKEKEKLFHILAQVWLP